MASAYPLEEHCLISKGLYSIVNDIVGSKCKVKIKQQTYELIDTIWSCDTSLPLTNICSGSMAEGFDFESSDFDFMQIDRNIVVLHGISSHVFDTSDIPTVLCMETDNIAPGFALLRFIRHDYRKLEYPNCLVVRGNSVYFSSKIARESHLASRNRRIHGPCSTGVFINGQENDAAYTLKSQIWPTRAESFIYRSLRYGWPSLDVLTDICKDGCLFVPIHSKQQTDNELIDLEWRISFSLAEKKLIHSMNHCQFLCYGLMKIFLNEVLKKIPETGELLCSYFMKTAVFCEISENPYNWTPSNFMEKTWNVFRRIMNWVFVEYCPNYFIPEHNMFFGKIYGIHQRNLMLRLRTLYDEGYLCFLRCSSLYGKLSVVINQPFLVNFLPTNEDDNSRIGELQRVASIALCSALGLPSKDDPFETLWTTACLIPTSDVMAATIRLRVNYIFQSIALALHSDSCNRRLTANKISYQSINTCQSILCRTKTTLYSNEVYSAVCLYRNGNYKKTLETIRCIKEKLQRQSYMYMWNLDRDVILGCRQQGMTYDMIIKTYVINFYKYRPETSIEELYMESHACVETSGGDLTIPPLVFLHFLLFLSLSRLYGTDVAHDVLCELQALVNYEYGHHIFFPFKAISWEILGICQQICGDYHGAYQSYVNALNDKCNGFKEATIARICSLFSY
ncbi:hypothetical protein FSP39_021064 [Pinctada imbricata]|uniref:Mab-21-like HhH/H2TH-like domain-containing protein n=1 Tax=Pinctada imbricata TaxID=66713 RepID=A0AA88XSE2_PINIB|nr:hypothetical protein FSP39_021064 [Pinctada imbricata]